MKCKQCSGFGVIQSIKKAAVSCDLCSGTGNVDSNKVLWQRQGQLLKDFRIQQGLTLRSAGDKYGIDYSNLSKMERGVIQPVPYYLSDN